ncbi:hypothetical protein OKW11_005874 [Pseudomonas baetica]|nr:hypothetical protein [Pseudomonas baetica]
MFRDGGRGALGRLACFVPPRVHSFRNSELPLLVSVGRDFVQFHLLATGWAIWIVRVAVQERGSTEATGFGGGVVTGLAAAPVVAFALDSSIWWWSEPGSKLEPHLREKEACARPSPGGRAASRSFTGFSLVPQQIASGSPTGPANGLRGCYALACPTNSSCVVCRESLADERNE